MSLAGEFSIALPTRAANSSSVLLFSMMSSHRHRPAAEVTAPRAGRV
jgi:hypothetical protein